MQSQRSQQYSCLILLTDQATVHIDGQILGYIKQKFHLIDGRRSIYTKKFILRRVLCSEFFEFPQTRAWGLGVKPV